jgi:hypothetical protein
MGTEPDDTRKGIIDTLISDLKTAGIWAKLDVLWVLAAHDAQAARLNWKAPASFALTAVNSPTFTTDRGYAGNGSTSYLTTGWDPATNGSQWTQNNAEIAFWSRTSTVFNGNVVGSESSASVGLNGRFTGDLIGYRVNAALFSGIGTSTDGSGFFSAARTGASASQGYKSGSAVGSAASAASGALSSVDIAIGRVNGTPSAHEVAQLSLGAALSGTERTDFYNALQTYMTAVGA